MVVVLGGCLGRLGGGGGGGAVRGAEVRLKGNEPRLDSGSINWILEAHTHLRRHMTPTKDSTDS